VSPSPPRPQAPGFFEVIDAFGNVVGYVPMADFQDGPPWAAPGERADPDVIRRVVRLHLQKFLIPKVRRWWTERPEPDASSQRVVEWWEAYPIDSDVPDV
jgi:hypothetical protein